MRRPFTLVSGVILPVIFLGLAQLLITSLPAAPAASASSFHPAAAVPQPPAAAPARVLAVQLSYTVHRGDTLSSIARRELGHTDRWPALWLANRKAVPDPDMLPAGIRLKLAIVRHPLRSWVAQAALDAIPKPPEPQPASAVQAAAQPAPAAAVAAPAAAPAPPAAQPAAVTGYSTGGSFEACVIQAESGGNVTAQNPGSTASGLYGFLDTTWTAVTGLPGPARDYSAAQQQAAFDKLYASAGSSPWSAYDGC